MPQPRLSSHGLHRLLSSCVFIVPYTPAVFQWFYSLTSLAGVRALHDGWGGGGMGRQNLPTKRPGGREL